MIYVLSNVYKFRKKNIKKQHRYIQFNSEKQICLSDLNGLKTQKLKLKISFIVFNKVLKII